MIHALPLADFEPGEAAPPATRYNSVAAWLHWIIGLALLGQIAFGFLLDEIAPRGTPGRAATINLHKSFGVVLGAAIALRILWRLFHSPPSFAASMPMWQRRSARSTHLSLYACMATMPLSGYVASNFSAHGLRFFGHTLLPWGPNLPRVYDALTTVHEATAWLFVSLIALHVLAAVRHAWAGDGVIVRMLPDAVHRRLTQHIS